VTHASPSHRPPSAAAISLQLLGATQLRHGGAWIQFGREKRFQLLAFLAYRGDWVDRERLLALLWGDVPDAVARRNLRQVVFKLRRLSWLASFEVEAERLRWRVATDVAAFVRAHAHGAWEAALERNPGPLLPQLDELASAEFAAWLAVERDRLETLRRDAVLALARRHEHDERYAEAAARYQGLLERDDLDEEALRGLMAAEARGGRAVRALAAYRGFRKHLAAELGIEPSRETVLLAETIDRGALPPLAVPAAPGAKPHGLRTLPEVTTTFVGRGAELATVTQYLARSECRLLTLIGIGGVGKSRLALEASRVLADRYADGVAFVTLEAVTDIGVIPARIAEVLGLSLSGGDPPLEQLTRHLAAQRLLLVLDNFEQLMAGAGMIDRLLRAAPHLDVLVSSRERLALEAEWLLPLGGLDVPGPDAPVEAAKRHASVVLFEERARRVRPGFVLDEREWPGVRAVCRLVQGVPLALELAAAWARLLPCADIAREIERTVDFLAGASRDRPGRQQSLRATFEHSWGLLAHSEQAALRNLSVFLGGFRPEAAAFVTGASLPVLASLADKSLLSVAATDRYDRHPLLYAFTVEKLAEHAEDAARLRDRHAEYFLALLAPGGLSTDDGLLRTIDGDLENVIRAWRHAIARRSLRDIGPAATALARYFEMRGRFQEGCDHLEEAARALSTATAAERRLVGHLRVHQAWLAHWLENARGIAIADEGLRLLRPLRDRTGVARALRVLGVIAWRAGDYAAADARLREALALLEAPGVVELRATVLDAWGLVASALGDYQEAERRHREALAINEAHGYRLQAVHNLVNLASFLWRIADPNQALGYAERALAIASEADFQQYLPFCLAEIGWSRLALDQHEEADALAQAAVGIARRHGDTFALTLSLLLAAQADAERGPSDAGEAALREALGVAWSIRDLGLVLRAVRVAASRAFRRGDPELALAWLELVRSHPASPHWNVLEAERWIDRVAANLAGPAAARATSRGRDLELAAIVARLLEPGTR
jgi:predicted ATPase/DNA-binding SARP family transcriptional activator